jgi:hypothetical protein
VSDEIIQLVEYRPAPAEAPLVAAPAEDMPPVGSSWRYGFRDERHNTMREQFFTISVTGIDGSTVHDSFSPEGAGSVESSIGARELRFTTRPLAGGYKVIELAPYLRNWAKPGSRQSAAAGYPSGPAEQWQVDAPQMVDEEIAVSAGKFKTVRVQVSGTLSSFGGLGSSSDLPKPARFRYTAWYAPEIKRYVKIRHQTWNRAGATASDEVVQLVEYRPAPAQAPSVAAAPEKP